MEPTEKDGARLLAPLRDVEPASRSTVSVDRAIHVGARRQRARQVLGTAMVVGLTALGVAVLPSVLSGQWDAAPATQVGEFEVLRQEFDVGSAGGFTPVSYETGRYRQQVRLRPADGAEGLPEWANVTMYAPGRLPDRDDSRWMPEGDQAPDVHGRRALWLPEPLSARDGTELAWEWGENAWAFAYVDKAGGDARGMVHRIAQSVRPGAGRTVPLPFTVPEPAPDEPNQLVGVISPFGTSSDVFAGGLLVFGRYDPVRADDADRILVGVRRDLTHDLVSGDARQAPVTNTQLAGHAAAVTSTAVTIVDAGAGYSAVAETTSPRLASQQELTDLATSVRFVADPTDQRSWSTTPLR